MPIARGLGLSPFPRPERFYFAFGKAIDMRTIEGGGDDDEALLGLRSQVAAEIEALIEKLKKRRHRDEDQGVLRRVLRGF